MNEITINSPEDLDVRRKTNGKAPKFSCPLTWSLLNAVWDIGSLLGYRLKRLSSRAEPTN